MKQKSSLIAWSDRLLFAPWRYMDFQGNNAHAGPLVNFINKPEAKAMALASASLAAINFSVMDTLQFLGIGGSVIAATGMAHYFRPDTDRHYSVDAYPDTPVPLHDTQRAQLEKDAGSSTMSSGVNLGMNFAAAAGLYGLQKLVGLPDDIALKSSLAVLSYLEVRALALRYRIQRVLKEEWALCIGAPPEEPAYEPEPERRLSPAIAPRPR